MQTTYLVKGMTCEHCANAVTQEVASLPGVEAVDVSVETGEVTVTSESGLAADEVRGAVDEAGYELVGLAGLARTRSKRGAAGRGAVPSRGLSADCPRWLVPAAASRSRGGSRPDRWRSLQRR